VYFQGGKSTLSNYIGDGYKAYGFDVPGVPGAVDQVHIFQAMKDAVTGRAR
jgi:alkaline phosphatase